MAKPKSSRISATLSASTKDALEELALQRGMSLSAFVQEMIEQGIFIETAIKTGGVVFIRTKEGKEFPVASSTFGMMPKSNQKLLKK